MSRLDSSQHIVVQEEQKEDAAIKTEPEVVEEVKEEDEAENKEEEEAAEQEKEVKGEEKEEAKEEAKKEKPAKEKKPEKKAEEAKGSKRLKTMQCKVTLLDNTQFECELDVRDVTHYPMLSCLFNVTKTEECPSVSLPLSRVETC